MLETSRLWREVVHRVHDEEFPEVELEDLLDDEDVDAEAVPEDPFLEF